MKYKRQEIFSIARVLDQIVQYLKEYHRLPVVIYLPPEERVYITYLTNDASIGINTIAGIPLEVYYDEQTIAFSY